MWCCFSMALDYLNVKYKTLNEMLPTKETLETAYLNKIVGGSVLGPIDMGDNKITSSYIPVEDNDLINKKYFDEQSSSGGSGNGKKYTTVVIGSSTAGYTSNDVDYLCDGQDDDVEINQAIQALPVDGGKIIILDGTYNIKQAITINKDNIVIEGLGNSTHLLTDVYTDNIAAIVILNKNIQVRDIFLSDMGSTTPSSLGWVGISINTTAELVTISNCSVTDYSSCIISAGQNVVILNCYIRATKTSSNEAIVVTSQTRQTISNCYIQDSGEGSSINNTMLINNYIQCYKISLGPQVKILNNYLFNTRLYCDGSSTINTCSESIIASNYCLGNNLQQFLGVFKTTIISNNYIYGGQFWVNVNNCDISNNCIYNGEIQFVDAQGPSTKTKINNNIIIYEGGTTNPSISGVIDNSMIIGNYTTNGISVSGSTNIIELNK